MKTIALALFALAVCAPVARAQDAPPLPITRVAQRAKAPTLFAPRGWKTEKIARGDLNRDGRSDAAVVLVETKPAHIEDGIDMGRARALVIALQTRNGWQRVGFSNQLLLGTRDGGAFYGASDAPVDVSVDKGVVIVGMEFGAREVTVTTHRLRYEPARRAVYLIGFDAAERDRGSGAVTTRSTNYLTGRRIITTMPASSEREIVVNTRVPSLKKRVWLGAIKEADRYTP